MRSVALGILVPALATGCIIYEERIRTITLPCEECDATVTDTPPEDTAGPVVDRDLFLSINAATAGDETVLTTLESRSSRDFSEFEDIQFDRDVVLADRIVREDEVVLVLEVAAEAEPGPVEVVVLLDEVPRLLESPFVIEPGDGSTTAPEDTGTTTPSTPADTGSASP